MSLLSSSNQIQFLKDPLTDAYPFGREVNEFCFNTSQWIAQQRAFHDVAMQFGYIALAIGFLLGMSIAYRIFWVKYGRSK